MVINQQPNKGKSESIKLGIKNCKESEGYMFFVGDKVTRKKYNHDVVFRIKRIDKGTYYLIGEDIRLEATSLKDDLRLYEKDIREENYDFIVPKDDSMIYGKVLHIDGDYKYLEKSLKLYKLNDVPVVGYFFEEKEIPNKITSLLVKHKPDILVITGHDSYRNINSEEFKNEVYNIPSKIYQVVS